ncbi:amino acid/amide ABC transporter membrane protein 1, HAAT family [Desulfonispora thiosulfatigenes DSM 11270]|uniref:Amino acid/amide ABC transporter membrane protein 1, HAAT family n=1 Tax=Desulfonispora thiosulfatigenes DSM 11270 TaxID=656914 RepID=A0A1W1UDY8_DESTI|nr:branched-chain amino acid ABC transporter permease [Desulfonispora thiosulfatigenes]SMB79305.1 amino acid/amide ABC transporter membrane protein 1, HAAT family [Desulfonispora thiosulfatigenes DSM 11270]
MDQFLQQLINGVSLGSIYALIALGYTMVYGIINLINFAHGDIYMIGAYVGFAAITYGNVGFFPALVLAMVVCSVLGVAIERIAYKPLRNATRIAALITAIGVSLFLEYSTMFVAGPTVRSYPNVLTDKTFHLGEVIINMQQIYIILITIVLMLLLQFIVHKTKVGKAMRAVSIDADAAQLMGIKVDRTISYTFAIGSALAGAAGVLVGIYYNSIDPLMGIMPGLKAFVAAVFGGIGIIPGAMLGGYFIGVAETLVSGYGNSMLKDAVVFSILILVLIIKPAGLLGKNTKEKV